MACNPKSVLFSSNTQDSGSHYLIDSLICMPTMRGNPHCYPKLFFLPTQKEMQKILSIPGLTSKCFLRLHVFSWKETFFFFFFPDMMILYLLSKSRPRNKCLGFSQTYLVWSVVQLKSRFSTVLIQNEQTLGICMFWQWPRTIPWLIFICAQLHWH